MVTAAGSTYNNKGVSVYQSDTEKSDAQLCDSLNTFSNVDVLVKASHLSTLAGCVQVTGKKLE